jgi:hypothetical protein
MHLKLCYAESEKVDGDLGSQTEEHKAIILDTTAFETQTESAECTTAQALSELVTETAGPTLEVDYDTEPTETGECPPVPIVLEHDMAVAGLQHA